MGQVRFHPAEPRVELLEQARFTVAQTQAQFLLPSDLHAELGKGAVQALRKAGNIPVRNIQRARRRGTQPLRQVREVLQFRADALSRRDQALAQVIEMLHAGCQRAIDVP